MYLGNPTSFTKMKTIQATIFFLSGITVVYFSFSILYYGSRFEFIYQGYSKHKWCRLIHNITCSNTSVNVNRDLCFNLAKQYLNEKIPMSLWHNPNREHVDRNDRIHHQRKLMEYLSHIEDQIPVKNILVVLSDGPSDQFKPVQHKEPLCPYNYTIIRNKCNFVRQNVTKIKTKSLNLQDYDAVVYHTKRTAEMIDNVLKPTTGQPTPLLIFFDEESPFVESVNLGQPNKIIATYWSNADISLPYGKWINDTRRSQFTEFLPNAYEGRNFAKGKTKLAAWIVSNCHASNRRLEIMRELRQYIPVDIYGNCSPEKKKCDPNCFEMLKRDYKFYFAFENANCRDYITEKLYSNAYQNDVVPIVMGAHPDDYKANAPPHSYIHVEDFNSPESLAAYLLLLDQNDELYNEYFHWKGKGQFIKAHNDFFCRACAMTIYNDFYPMPKWPKRSTLKSENHCMAKNSMFWNP